MKISGYDGLQNFSRPAFFPGILGNSTELADKREYNLKAVKLDDKRRDEILKTLSQLGFQNLDRGKLSYYYSTIPQGIIDKMKNGSERDKATIAKSSFDAQRSHTFKSDIENRLRTFIVPSQIEDIAFDLGKSQEDALTFVLMHELTHRMTSEHYLEKVYNPWTAELIADYVAVKATDPEICFLLRVGQPGGEYFHSRDATTQAVRDELTSIDASLSSEKLLEDMRRRIEEGETKSVKGAIVNKTTYETFNDCVAAFYDENIAPLKKAPGSAQVLIRNIFKRFENLLEAQAHSLAPIARIRTKPISKAAPR